MKKKIRDLLLNELPKNYDNLGIPGSGFIYQNLGEGQDAHEEYLKTNQFLKTVFFGRVEREASELFDLNSKLEFINYGDTQQVYVLTVNDKQWSVLVSQPGVEFGIVKREYDNLRNLSINNSKLIVRPEYYFEEDGKELYVSPYIYQARCIASQECGYGVYIPEPYYRFEVFPEHIKKIVNTCIIANLVKLYDEEKGQGIGSCKIGGGDFILEKSWDATSKSIADTLDKMKLIAARDMITMNLSDYEQSLLEEFSLRTYYKAIEDRDSSILINHKNRVAMSYEEISDGIKLGRQLRKIR